MTLVLSEIQGPRPGLGPGVTRLPQAPRIPQNYILYYVLNHMTAGLRVRVNAQAKSLARIGDFWHIHADEKERRARYALP